MQVIYKIRILGIVMALIGSVFILGLGITAWKQLNNDRAHQSNSYTRQEMPLKIQKVSSYDSVVNSGKDVITTENFSIIF